MRKLSTGTNSDSSPTNSPSSVVANQYEQNLKMLEVDIPSIGALNNNFDGSPRRKRSGTGQQPIIFDVDAHKTSSSSSSSAVDFSSQITPFPVISVAEGFTSSLISTGAGVGSNTFGEVLLGLPTPLARGFSFTSSLASPTPSGLFPSLSFSGSEKTPSSSFAEFSFSPQPSMTTPSLPYDLETPRTTAKRMNSVLVDSPHPIFPSPPVATATSNAVANSILSKQGSSLQKTLVADRVDSVSKEINPFSLDSARVSARSTSSSKPPELRGLTSSATSGLSGTVDDLKTPFLLGLMTPSLFPFGTPSSSFFGGGGGGGGGVPDPTPSGMRNLLATPPINPLAWGIINPYFNTTLPQQGRFVQESDITGGSTPTTLATISSMVSAPKATAVLAAAAAASPAAKVQHKKPVSSRERTKEEATHNTFLENARLLEVAASEIPRHLLDNNRKSQEKRRKTDQDDDDLAIPTTHLAEIHVPRKRKGVDDDEEVVRQKKLRRKER